MAAHGVRTMVVRLSQVHDRAVHGLASLLVELAREKGVSADLGEGENRWAAAPRFATARLFRLVMEKGMPGKRYNAVAEEGVLLKDIAEAIRKRVKVPVVAKSAAEAAHFGFLAPFIGWELAASSALTR